MLRRDGQERRENGSSLRAVEVGGGSGAAKGKGDKKRKKTTTKVKQKNQSVMLPYVLFLS